MQKRLFLLVIALLILVPATGVVTGLGSMSEQDMRASEGRNKTKLQEDFPKWFTDNLGLRQFFANTYSTLLLFLFDASSDPERVQIGQNDFLFLGTTLAPHAGLSARKTSLAGFGNGFTHIITLFQKEGIPVLVAIAPAKATVYGEYFPAWVRRVSRSFPRENLDDSPLLRRHVLLLEDALLGYKKYTDSLYWKNDTHWNPVGAFLGYTTIMNEMERLLEKKFDRVQLLGWKTGKYRKGDLERMNRAAKSRENSIELLTTPMDTAFQTTKDKNLVKYTNQNYLNDLKVAIIYDSFYYAQQTAYRNTFHTTYEIHLGQLNTQIIKTFLSENPPLDLVIFLIVERNIFRLDRLLNRINRELSAAPR